MSDKGAGKQVPLSPPTSEWEGLKHGLHHSQEQRILLHNQSNSHALDDGFHLRSQSGFATPEPRHLPFEQYRGSPYKSVSRSQDDLDPVNPYDHYGNPIFRSPQRNEYQSQYTPQHLHYPPPEDYYISTALTPADSDQSGGRMRRKRSYRSDITDRSAPLQRLKTHVETRSSTNAQKKAAKPARKKKGKSRASQQITGPLSELTKSYTEIPIRDINAWVNRSTEERLTEINAKTGYIKRPMNSFMLYRSAYAERTKMWCLQNNHQVVSSISGESWPLEPQEVRDLYIEYAKIERDNHAKAHPNYKFSPSKPNTLAKKRTDSNEEEDESEPSDLDDPEWLSGRYRKEKRQAHRTRLEPRGTSFAVKTESRRRKDVPSRQVSSYQFNNPGKPLPLSLNTDEIYGEYYNQTDVQQGTHGGVPVEDILVRQARAPTMQYQHFPPPLVGLPGADHYDLLDQHRTGNGEPLFDNNGVIAEIEPAMDPLLPSYGSNYMGYMGGIDDAPNQSNLFQDIDELGSTVHQVPEFIGSQSHNQPNETFSSQQYDPQLVGDEGNPDFEEWIEQHNNK